MNSKYRIVRTVRIWIARGLLHAGWKILGVRVSPGMIMVDGRQVNL